MIEIYDKAKEILRACGDIDAVITTIEETEERGDDTIKEACLVMARCALATITVEMRSAADAIVKLTGR